MADLTYEVKIDFGNIGGKKKLTYMSWNGNTPRYDIRDWYDEKAGKGIALDKDELNNLYGLLRDMFEETEEEIEEEADDNTLLSGILDGIKEESSQYPEEIKETFDILDKLFKGFNIYKEYGKMPFADGDRLQYHVTKGKKAFPDYDAVLEKFDLKSFVTDKGNLYIYTL